MALLNYKALESFFYGWWWAERRYDTVRYYYFETEKSLALYTDNSLFSNFIFYWTDFVFTYVLKPTVLQRLIECYKTGEFYGITIFIFVGGFVEYYLLFYWLCWTAL